MEPTVQINCNPVAKLLAVCSFVLNTVLRVVAAWTLKSSLEKYGLVNVTNKSAYANQVTAVKAPFAATISAPEKTIEAAVRVLVTMFWVIAFSFFVSRKIKKAVGTKVSLPQAITLELLHAPLVFVNVISLITISETKSKGLISLLIAHLVQTKLAYSPLPCNS